MQVKPDNGGGFRTRRLRRPVADPSEGAEAMPDEEGHPTRSEMDLLTVLNALSDPLRYEVIQTFLTLPEGTERTCLSFGFPVSKSTLSHHFRILRESGLVQQVNRGNSRKAHLRREDLEARFPGLLELLADNPPAPPAGSDPGPDATAPAPSRAARPGRATGR